MAVVLVMNEQLYYLSMLSILIKCVFIGSLFVIKGWLCQLETKKVHGGVTEIRVNKDKPVTWIPSKAASALLALAFAAKLVNDSTNRLDSVDQIRSEKIVIANELGRKRQKGVKREGKGKSESSFLEF